MMPEASFHFVPRLIRRKPRWERIKDYLNPGDFLLWLSEELETRDWDSKRVATPLALGLHVVFLIARANSGSTKSNVVDDVFSDISTGAGWLSYIASLVVSILLILSCLNAYHTFTRKRHYRLFESNIDAPPSTPSANRVRVGSSPVSSSPLRFLMTILGDPNAESRAHPDSTRDVWELAVWDPIPVCLQLFCLFSPGHVAVYLLLLPTTALDPHPSVTVFTTVLLQLVMSLQLLALQSWFSQQEKDSAIIHKEVMSEYDIKFVHPRLNPLVRDVGTQFSGPESEARDQDGDIDTYTPNVILKREFRTNPNPNYAKYVDPDNVSGAYQRNTFSPGPSFISTAFSRETTPYTGRTSQPGLRQPQFHRKSTGATSTGMSMGGDGGSLGVYSHANSPLKKATSMYDIQTSGHKGTPKNSFDMASREIQEQKERSQSPTKRQSQPQPQLMSSRTHFPGVDNERRTSIPAAFGVRSKPYESPYKRGPSRW